MPFLQYEAKEIAEIMRQHNELLAHTDPSENMVNKSDVFPLRANQIFSLIKASDLDVFSRYAYINCTILVAKEFTGVVRIRRAAGLTIVFHSDCDSENVNFEIERYYYSYATHDALGRMRPRTLLVDEEGRNVMDRYICAFNCSVSRLHDLSSVCKECLDFELKNHKTKTAFVYKNQSYFFSKRTFAAGVELEIPSYYSVFYKSAEVDKKFWTAHTDHSQIEGDLECVSKPVSLHYLKSKRFEERVKKLWIDVEAPAYNSAYYTDEELEDEEDTQSSGVHLHVSWHHSIGLDARRLRECFIQVVRERGGERYLLEVGGKSKHALRHFSPLKPLDVVYTGEKYDAVRVVSQNHIEMRWMSSHENPAVVVKRIRAAIDLFEASVLRWQKNTSEQLISNHLCRTLLPIQMRCKKLSPEQPTTAPAPAQAQALSDLPVLAPPFSL